MSHSSTPEAVQGSDPYAPEKFSRESKVLLEAVHEALEYVARTMPPFEREHVREAADVRARGLDRPREAAFGGAAES